jgi:hypothetical protein
MRLQHHPEYIKVLQDRETVQRCRQAVAAWQAEGEPILAARYGIRWTHERALTFVRSLVRMFQAYNRVLWERFPYCRACGGGCCVLDASYVGPFDGIALALLDLPVPALPEAIATSARECVYLNRQACTWPVEWRTIKCWSFYCLGGRWDPSVSLGEQHGVLARALKGVVLDLLPEELRRYQEVRGDPLIAHLDDPTDLAAAFRDALAEILVAPFDALYPVIARAQFKAPDVSGEALSPDEGALSFVAQAMEALLGSAPPSPQGIDVSPEQLLADLESIEWIVVGRPANQLQLLQEMHARYASAPAPRAGEEPTLWYRARGCIGQMLAQLEDIVP